MAYIGNTPAEAFSSFQKQDFSTSATTSYTLDHPVSNQNEIALFINFVRQEPTAAYTASGTTLTLTSATSSSDDMYCVYLGKAVQTVNPPSGSVGSSQVASTIITGQTAETSIATDDTILIHDTSASALRKMTRANFVSGIGGANTPAFSAKSATQQSISNETFTDVDFGTEVFDTDNAFASHLFTVPSGKGGKYYLYAQAGRQVWDSDRFLTRIVRTPSGGVGDEIAVGESAINTSGYHTTETSCIFELTAGDVIKVQVWHNSGSTRNISSGVRTVFQGYKIIE
jgi:hypothetical protein